MKTILFLFCLLTIPCFIEAQEICDNGIDDDFDGLIDLLDTIDCPCDFISFSSLNSFIPNPSFEDTICCPDTFSQMNCVTTWQQASMNTPDYFNLCGFDSLPPANGLTLDHCLYLTVMDLLVIIIFQEFFLGLD